MIQIIYADGPAGPRMSPETALKAAGVSGPTEVLLGWTPAPMPWLDSSAITAKTVFAGPTMHRVAKAGRLSPRPARLGSMAKEIREQPPDIAVVAGVRRGAGFSFGRAVGWADVAARFARHVVVEVDENGTDLGGPLIEGNIVGVIPRSGDPGLPPPARNPDDVDMQIGRRVAALLPDEATLELGLGKLPAAVLAAVDRPIKIWTGLLDEGTAELHARGLLAAPAVASYTWGANAIDELHRSGMLDLRSATHTHDIARLAKIQRFVACNGALQVGLDGSVNVEQVGGRLISGIGGHSDFSAGASLAPGGLSIVALRSTTSKGRSTIVKSVERVSTQRSDIDLVVTEYGVADLRRASEQDRMFALAAVAAPEHRLSLLS